MGGSVSIQKDKVETPSTDSDDGGGGGLDMADLAQELDQDEFDGQVLSNGE